MKGKRRSAFARWAACVATRGGIASQPMTSQPISPPITQSISRWVGRPSAFAVPRWHRPVWLPPARGHRPTWLLSMVSQAWMGLTRYQRLRGRQTMVHSVQPRYQRMRGARDDVAIKTTALSTHAEATHVVTFKGSMDKTRQQTARLEAIKD